MARGPELALGELDGGHLGLLVQGLKDGEEFAGKRGVFDVKIRHNSKIFRGWVQLEKGGFQKNLKSLIQKNLLY